ncbi:MAG: aspartate aminotransferase family protein [Candidatus Omnitrophica bacterium]|nr:aspartate aminotransferase family protein [Candidatus Omnitrophota bacterium]
MKLFRFPFKIGKKEKPLPKNLLPKIRTKIPGPQSLRLTELLKRFECPQLTYTHEPFPIFLKKASGANMIDVDRNRYLDLTSCFGVMGIGHSSPVVQEAMRRQAAEMIHGLGDVHPNEVKVLLAKKLSEITPGNLNQSFFSSTGAEAVETALKTAVMHTKKTGVIAFERAYHGLNYGALHVTHRADFRKPFAKQLGKHVSFAPFSDLKAVKKIIHKSRRSPHRIGAVILEPIQGRGGIHVAPPGFLKELRAVCDEEAALLIADEVFTGFGRTGSMFAMDKSGVVPDLLCLGKGMGGGFPISVCVGTTRVMHSWGASTGDAIHTSTYVGNPLGCAIALAVIGEIERRKFVDRSKSLGDFFRRELWKLKEKYPLIADVRGAGLMIGVEFGKPPAKARLFIEECLRGGILVLPAGEHHDVISITPPFVISEKEISFCVQQFEKILKKIS